MQKGNLAYRIEEKAGSAEFKEVFTSFNNMIQTDCCNCRFDDSTCILE